MKCETKTQTNTMSDDNNHNPFVTWLLYYNDIFYLSVNARQR